MQHASSPIARHLRHLGSTCTLLAAISGSACANELGGSGTEDSTGSVGVQSSELDVDTAGLAKGQSTLMVDKITNAENLLFTSDARLLVSGDDGIFQIVRDATGNFQSQPLHTGESCKFGGMTEVQHVVYANCYDFKSSQLFAAPLTDTLKFNSIFTLAGIALANGLTSDGVSSLYIAATFKGAIVRLTLANNDPLHVGSQETWIENAGLFADGIKYYNGAIYWTDFGNIKSATVSPDRTPGPIQTIVSILAFFDDIYVGPAGILACSSLAGTVQGYDFHGLPTGATPNNTFSSPSSVLPVQGRLGLPNDALVVTERGANKVSVFGP